MPACAPGKAAPTVSALCLITGAMRKSEIIVNKAGEAEEAPGGRGSKKMIRKAIKDHKELGIYQIALLQL